MIGLLQRVSFAEVVVHEQQVCAIDTGILVFIGIERGDDRKCAEKLLKRLLNYRLFSDNAGKMNLSLQDVNGGLLLVPQFTLVADTQRGARPNFSRAAAPELAQAIFADLSVLARNQYANVGTGIFGEDMEVKLVNSGPVTFWLQNR